MSEEIIDRKKAFEIARAKSRNEKSGYENRDFIATKKARKALNKKGLNENVDSSGFDIGKDYPFIFALLAAAFKDFMDLGILGAESLAATAAAASFGLLAGALTAIVAFGAVVSILTGMFIGIMMVLAGANEKKKLAKNTIKKFMVLLFGTGIESLFIGLNALPIETITVIVIIALTIAERKNIVNLPG